MNKLRYICMHSFHKSENIYHIIITNKCMNIATSMYMYVEQLTICIDSSYIYYNNRVCKGICNSVAKPNTFSFLTSVIFSYCNCNYGMSWKDYIGWLPVWVPVAHKHLRTYSIRTCYFTHLLTIQISFYILSL